MRRFFYRGLHMADSAKEQRMKIAELVESDSHVLDEMIKSLQGPSRRTRQNAASVFSIVASRKPELLIGHIDAFIDALNRPESQTRWECLDVLTALISLDSCACEKAIPGAESALFDEGAGSLHLSALRFLCAIGATTQARSVQVWPLVDEAIQCYHGDFEYSEMLSAVTGFAEGELDQTVKDSLKDRMAFDATSGKGALKKRSQQIVDILS